MPERAPATVAEYLEALPEERRSAIEAVRKVIRRNLPKGYQEALSWGAIAYEIPLERYPKTYNGKPLVYVSLASQKNYCALYLMGVYQVPEHAEKLKAAFAAAGKKADVGKACIRFGAADDLPLEAIGKLVAGTPVDAFIEQYEAARGQTARRR